MSFGLTSTVHEAKLSVRAAMRARLDPLGERAKRLPAVDPARSLPRHVTTADMHGDGMSATE